MSRRCPTEQPYSREGMTSRQTIEALILSGIQRSANLGSFETFGDLFAECDRLMALVTFKDESDSEQVTP